MVVSTIPDEKQIIADIVRGQKELYALLIARYNQRLYRIARSYIVDEAEVEDIMQDAYIKAFRKLDTFRSDSSFGTWITRIVINECLLRIKKNKQRQESGTVDELLLSDNTSPESAAINNELRRILEKNIDCLPEKYKIVFMMREVEQMSIDETSQALEISTANVKIRLNRAKIMLRDSLKREYPVSSMFEFHLIRCARVADAVLQMI